MPTNYFGVTTFYHFKLHKKCLIMVDTFFYTRISIIIIQFIIENDLFFFFFYKNVSLSKHGTLIIDWPADVAKRVKYFLTILFELYITPPLLVDIIL